MGKKLTNEEYIEQLKALGIWDRYRPLEEYQNDRVKIKHKCQACSHIWEVTPNSLKKGTGCPKCSGVYVPTNEEYKQEAISLGYTPLEEYKSAHVKIKHQCQACYHIWSVTPNNLKKGNGCPKCYDERRRLSNEEYREEAISLGYTPLEEYQNKRVKIKHQCQTCYHIWSVQPTNLKSGKGCPNCSNTNKAENLVNDYLESTYSNQFQAQKKFNDLVGVGGRLLSFDFYLEIGSNKYLIELQGIQHYKPIGWNPDYFHTQQEHDYRKYNYARNHGYIYVSIPNTCPTAEKESVIVPFLQNAIWLSETFGVQSHGYHLETCLESSSHTQEIMQTALF